MKKFLAVVTIALLTSTAQADFFGGNDGKWKMGPYGPYWEESDWPEWTPMYWMEEFFDNWDDDDDYGYGMPYGYGGYGGAYPMMPYGGYGYPAVPYGGYGYPAMPYYSPYGYYQAPVAPAPPVAPTP